MKKWTIEEENKLIELLKNKKTYLEVSIELKRTKRSIKEKSNRLGYYSKDFKNEKIKIKCLNCKKDIEISLYNEYDLDRRFCSHSCSAIFNNKKRKVKKNCVGCGVELIGSQKKFCSNSCQRELEYNSFIKKWKNGGLVKTKTKISGYIRRYLFKKYDNKCSKCGWNETNKFTGNIPIEVEHIDGNSENNKEENLTLLCPNCHSLTKTYKGANRGNGRHNRRERYKDGKSY